MQARKWTGQQMQDRYDAKTGKVSKILLLLIVLLFAVPVMLLFYNRKLYYTDHLAFATEFMNFVILGTLWLLPWLFSLFFRILWKVFHLAPEFNENTTGTTIVLALLLLQLSLSTKRVYRQPWYFTLPKVLALSVSFVLCVWAYRFILFHAVMMLL